MIAARPLLALLLLAVAAASCNMTKLIPGRCEKPADCSGGLTCDDHKTCVPTTAGPSPCSSSTECGSGYVCDNLHWCVCQNQGASAGNDPCADGRLPTYRGVETDGGTDGGDGGDAGDGDAGDGGDGGFKCQGNGDCPGSKRFCIVSTGACVECTATDTSQCNAEPAKPICDTATNTCVPCTTDSQCVAKLGSPDPGICMSHQDGHCATTAETVYAQNIPSCVSLGSTDAGTTDKPFCTIQAAIASLATRNLIVARGTVAGSVSVQAGSLSLIGQQSAKVSPAAATPGVQVSGASLYMRAVRVSAGDDVGIGATSGSTLSLDGVVVDNCAGGGIFIDASVSQFNVRNTTVSSSGTGLKNGISWGGILILATPDGGTSSLDRVTIQSNKWTGLTCSGPISGTGVFANANMGGDVTPPCGITLCPSVGTNCGAP